MRLPRKELLLKLFAPLIARSTGMIHLITVVGKVAKGFYLKPQRMSDFKSVLRTVTSGRVMIISTKFRSDLFYTAENSENEAILKLWALYTNMELSSFGDQNFITSIGAEASLSNFFQAMARLSANWYYYRQYKKAFQNTFGNDQRNPVALTVVDCDRHLTAHPSIKRSPLVDTDEKTNTILTTDTFSLAMRIINSKTHSN